jgi:pimeloyl-ACP methyl ester carboxylesterase
VHAAGQSAGAQLLLHLAARRPELLTSLSLHEPPSLGLLAGDPILATSEEDTSKAGALFRAGDLTGGLRVFLSYVGGDWDAIPEPIQEIFLHNAPNYIADWFDDLSHEFWTVDADALKSFGHPIQLTIGDRTTPTLRAISDKLAELLPGAEVAIIEEAGHGAMMEKPTEYAAAVTKFLASAR